MELPEPPLAPVVPDELAVQPNVEPATLLLSVMAVVPPEHIDIDDGVAVPTGFGFTVTVTVIGVPGQLFAVGVTVYTIVPGDVVVAVSVCAIVVPLPALPPVALVAVGAPHAKVVPATDPLSEMLVVPPEQMFCDEGEASAFGTGLTFTVTVNVVPRHPAAEGVTV